MPGCPCQRAPSVHPSNPALPPCSRSPFPSFPPPDDSIASPEEGGDWGGEDGKSGLGRNAWAEGEGRRDCASCRVATPSKHRASPCHFLAIRQTVETVPFNDLRVTKCCHSEPPKDAAGPARVAGAPVKGARAAGQVQIPDGWRMRRRCARMSCPTGLEARAEGDNRAWHSFEGEGGRMVWMVRPCARNKG